MTLHIYDDLEQRSPEWYAVRLGMVTASMVGKLVTPTLKVADNDVSRGVVAALTAERISGWSDPTFINDDMMRGILHEPLARDRYAEVNEVEVVEVGFMVRTFGTDRLGASPDGLIGDDGGLEVKCPRAKGHIATIADDAVPAQYVAQLQASMLVSGRSWWDFVSFCAGLPMFTKRVHADEKWHAAILAGLEQFEQRAADLAATYAQASAHLPATERANDNDLGLVF